MNKYSRVSWMKILKQHNFSFVSWRNLFSQQSRIPRISRYVVCHAVSTIVMMIRAGTQLQRTMMRESELQEKENDGKLLANGTSWTALSGPHRSWYHINDRTEEIETKERKGGQIFKFKISSVIPDVKIVDCAVYLYCGSWAHNNYRINEVCNMLQMLLVIQC